MTDARMSYRVRNGVRRQGHRGPWVQTIWAYTGPVDRVRALCTNLIAIERENLVYIHVTMPNGVAHVWSQEGWN